MRKAPHHSTSILGCGGAEAGRRVGGGSPEKTRTMDMELGMGFVSDSMHISPLSPPLYMSL